MKDVTTQNDKEINSSPEETNRILPDETVKTLSAQLNKMSWSNVHLKKCHSTSTDTERHSQTTPSLPRQAMKPKSDKALENTHFNDLSVADMMRLFGLNARKNDAEKLNAKDPIESKNQITP